MNPSSSPKPSAPRSPRELHQALAAAFNARDVDLVLALYQPDAALVPEPGQVASGRDQLRQALLGFLAVPGVMQIETVYAVQAGDVALTRSAWSLVDAGEVKLQACGTELMRARADGTWAFAVDHPFGADPVGG
jgi:uncharacterized protein (TIGR02246 family)